MIMTNKTKLLTVLTIAGALLLLGITRHFKTEADDGSRDAETRDVPVAPVVQVERGAIENSLTISGAFKAFQDVDVHAKVAGYIRDIYVDVGSHVKEGQTLAVLEVPELQAELSGADAAVRRANQEILRAQGDVQRARFSHAALHSMGERLTQASKQREGLVAQQEVDDAQSKDLASEAQVSSAEAALNVAQQALDVAIANQKQYKAMADYTRITAPFTGVVTVRYADKGALIAAGTASSTQSMPLVRIAQVSVLRLVLPIPESLAASIRLGDPVKVHVQALNQDIVGKVSRFADSLDPQTRTMETEIDFDNRNGKLIPGMYAETVLGLADRKNVLVVPLEGVTQKGKDARVLAVNARGVVEERKVQLGIQGKSRVEVLAGLNEHDLVIVGNQSQFRSGEKVTPKEVKLPDSEEGAS
jgi:RND family efflux transporter MFP subunit